MTVPRCRATESACGPVQQRASYRVGARRAVYIAWHGIAWHAGGQGPRQARIRAKWHAGAPDGVKGTVEYSGGTRLWAGGRYAMRPDGAPSAEWTDASDIGARCVTALEGNPVPVQMWPG